MMLPAHLPDFACIAAAVYGEARGEPFAGQLEVARVIRERVERRRWPNTACAVVLQPKQFDFVNHWGQGRESFEAQLRAWRRAFTAALIVTFEKPTPSPTHFVRYDENPYWRHKLLFSNRIGNHVFLVDNRKLAP